MHWPRHPYLLPLQDPSRLSHSQHSLWSDLLAVVRHVHALAQGNREKPGSPPVLSYGLDPEPLGLAGIPPLAFLRAWRAREPKPEDPLERASAYFAHTHPLEGYERLGLGSALIMETQGSQRFIQSREFVEQVSDRLMRAGEPGDPYFLAQFTFASTVGLRDPFPAGTVILPRWQISQQQGKTQIRVNLAISAQDTPETLVAEVQQTCQSWRQRPDFDHLPAPDTVVEMGGDPALFVQQVQQARDAIRAGSLQKVVLARSVDVLAASEFPIVATLQQLQQRYRDCYVFGIHRGVGPTFVGASPERLIKVQAGHVQIDALAGSAPRGQSLSQDRKLAQQLCQSLKDRREHEFVVQSIQRSLAQLGLTPQIEQSLGIRRLASIQHLHTTLTTELPPQRHLLELVDRLHPTAAVSGTPRPVACEWLHRREGFSRSLYAGPIGWLDTQGNGELAVGIRSALIQGSQAQLFAGAGVVADSDPQSESEEVRLKLLAMLDVLMQRSR
jgi:menaquinone-specific isochorismate synthase